MIEERNKMVKKLGKKFRKESRKGKPTLKLIIIAVLLVMLIFIFLNFKNNFRNNQMKKESNKEIVRKALLLYEKAKKEGMNFSSQCLGTIYVNNVGYAVDIVHVPRSKEDNLPENQCKEYRKGIVKHFIELDKYGNVIRIV